MLRFFIYLLFLSMSLSFYGAKKNKNLESNVQATLPLISAEAFADPETLLSELSLEQKIAQLMVVRSFAENEDAYYQTIADNMARYQYGGICFFKGKALQMVKALNMYQAKSSIPLLVTIDGEWGVAMRLTDVLTFPRQQTLGALQNDSLIYQMGVMIGEQCKRLGIHFNYIPTVDINNNPNNPVINTRSFGENKYKVAEKGVAYYKGMNSTGVMGSAKHFPGHGDTDIDSHYDLPYIRHSRETLDTLDLYPFRKMIEAGVHSIMVAHLNIPALDTNKGPASLSALVIDSLLKKQLGYQGLIFTDGLEMTGVTQAARYPGEVEVRALAAGNHILLLPLDPPASIAAIKKAVEDSILSEALIDSACLRILRCKYNLGLLDTSHFPIVVSSDSLLRDLNKPQIKALNRKIFSEAITLLQNKENILPIRPNAYKSIACIHIGDTIPLIFEDYFKRYAKADHYYLHRDFSPQIIDSLKNIFSAYELCVVDITNTNYAPARNYGVTSQSIALIDSISRLPGACVLAVFAPPYVLKSFPYVEELDAILVGYQELAASLEVCPQIIFGALPAKGRLPISIDDKWKEGFGMSTFSDILAYREPAEVGLSYELCKTIDSLANLGVQEGAYPGCQIAIAKDGAIIYEKSFGHFTYDSTSKSVTNEDLYDIASLTKIVSTTLAMMKLYDEKKYELDDKISFELKHLKRTNKKDISFRQVLSHQAGLPAGVTIYMDSLYKDKAVFSSLPSKHYQIPISDSLFIYDDYEKHIRKVMDESPINPNPKYLYSDVGFYYLKEFIESVSEEDLNDYVETNFYSPLALSTTTYLPLQKFLKAQIVPTEKDKTFRNEILQGYVHDPSVALMGGVGASAGLFSNASDLLKIGQMLLQNGEYGGLHYIDSATISLFTSSNFSSAENRRGGGFDKPALKSGQSSPTASSASACSYGHSGFTGTYMWIDPEYNIVYVFLSNRIYPDAENKKLQQMNLRTDIQELICNELNSCMSK